MFSYHIYLEQTNNIYMQRKYAHCCSVCFVLLVCGWFKPAGKKKRFSHLLGFVELRLSPPQRLSLGIPIKSKNRKRAGVRWEEGKGLSRPLVSLSPSHRAPRAFFFLGPRPHPPPPPMIKRGLGGGAERGATERIFRQIRAREQQKFWGLVRTKLNL